MKWLSGDIASYKILGLSRFKQYEPRRHDELSEAKQYETT
jgi:hypothetical protein